MIEDGFAFRKVMRWLSQLAPLVIRHLEPEAITQLPAIMKEVYQLLDTLSEQPPHEIQMPIYFNGREFASWNKNAEPSSPKNPFRYWLLKVYDASASSERIYDRQRKAVIDISYTRIAQITKQL